jgi:hypothetical protein
MSVPSLAGWRRMTVDGGVMLVPADPTTGFFRIRAREALRPLSHVVADLLRPGLGGLPAELSGAPRVVATDEGEFAALVEFHAKSGERELRRHVGIIFGDEHIAIVDGRVAHADQFDFFRDIVERLTTSYCMGLGGDRWRRYFYRPPRGWDGVERHRADVWLPPRYPKNPGMITVFHARPEQTTRPMLQHGKLFEELTSEYGKVGPGEPQPIQTESGMVGQVVQFQATLGGALRRAANVGFSDGRYVYLMRIESDDEHKDANTEAFLGMVRSVKSLPWPRQDLGVLVHWSD